MTQAAPTKTGQHARRRRTLYERIFANKRWRCKGVGNEMQRIVVRDILPTVAGYESRHVIRRGNDAFAEWARKESDFILERADDYRLCRKQGKEQDNDKDIAGLPFGDRMVENLVVDLPPVSRALAPDRSAFVEFDWPRNAFYEDTVYSDIEADHGHTILRAGLWTHFSCVDPDLRILPRANGYLEPGYILANLETKNRRGLPDWTPNDGVPSYLMHMLPFLETRAPDGRTEVVGPTALLHAFLDRNGRMLRGKERPEDKVSRAWVMRMFGVLEGLLPEAEDEPDEEVVERNTDIRTTTLYTSLAVCEMGLLATKEAVAGTAGENREPPENFSWSR